jgi:hypothetical protein
MTYEGRPAYSTRDYDKSNTCVQCDVREDLVVGKRCQDRLAAGRAGEVRRRNMDWVEIGKR